MNPALPLHEELTNAIVAAGRKVLEVLRPGLAPVTYANALVIELRKRGIPFEQHKVFDVHYEGELIDLYVARLVIEGFLLVDCFSVDEFDPEDLARVAGALTISQLNVAVLLNFRDVDLGWRRLDRIADTTAVYLPA